MLLCDKLKEDGIRMGISGDGLFDNARIVVVHRDVVEAASTLADTSSERLPSLSKFTCWPDYRTWVETQKDDEGRRLGFLFYGNLYGSRSVTEGLGMVFIEYDNGDTLGIQVKYLLEKYALRWAAMSEAGSYPDLVKTMPPELRQKMMQHLDRTDGDPIAKQAEYGPILNAIKPLLFSILAFMNSPKIISRRPVDVSRLNKRRVKRGKFPYHPHHEIRLNIDKHRLNITPATGEGSERGQYFVRAHLRFLVHPRFKNVSVTLVEPHYRGNPEIGIRKTSYAVERQTSVWSD